ncbi:MAG: efflux RND transporter periplasmic adaptor subunit [Pseudomonadota bacterium]
MKTSAVKHENVVERLRSLEIDRAEDEQPQRRYWPGAAMGFLCLAIGALAYAAWLHDSSDTPIETAARKDVRTNQPSKTTVARPLVADTDWLVAGYLVARRESLVSAEVTATVAALFVDSGMIVAAGDVIAQLDGSLAQADLGIETARAEAAKRTIEAIRAERQEAASYLDRITTLVDDGAVARVDFDRAKARFDTLTAQQRKTEAEREMAVQSAARAQVFLDKHTIAAPFAGVVTDCDVQVGETVSPMAANGSSGVGVCTIVDPTSIEIEIDVPEPLISRVKIGAAAEAFLDAYPDDALPATVTAIAPEASREKSTIQVRLAFADPDPRLRPNMAVKVNFKTSYTE